MDRRQLLRALAAAAALPIAPRSAEEVLAFGQAAHARAAARSALRVLDPEQEALVTLVADMIIPRTDTPGAADAGVTQFIDLLLAEWYPTEEREKYLAGLSEFERRARERTGLGFLDQTAPDRIAFLDSLDGVKADDPSAERWFSRTKSLTVYAYFTSKQVMLDVLRTVVIPERYEGCVRLQGPAGDD